MLMVSFIQTSPSPPNRREAAVEVGRPSAASLLLFGKITCSPSKMAVLQKRPYRRFVKVTRALERVEKIARNVMDAEVQADL